MGALRDGFASAWGAVSGWLGGMGGRVIGAIGNAGGWLVDVGRQMISGMISGVQSMAGSLISAVTSMIPGPIKKFLHIGSPSKLMATEVGEPISLGIAKGIEDAGHYVNAALRSVIPVPSDLGSWPGLGAGAGAGRIGPLVNVEQANFAEKLDIDLFMKQAAWTLQTQRI